MFNFSDFKTYLAASALVLTVYGCHDSIFWVGEKETIIIEYNNLQSEGPVVTPEPVEISPFTSIDHMSATQDAEGVKIVLNGVRVQSKLNNYTINDGDIRIRENTGGSQLSKWVEQSEFDNNASSAQSDVMAVLVLDVSSSIGEHITELKTYAKDFAKAILEGSPNSSVAVIVFSEEVVSYPFVSNGGLQALEDFIDNYTQYDDRTSLYQAVQNGLSMLNNASFNGSKTLIAFTDGQDNNTDNKATVINDIKASSILRYAIGVKANDFQKAPLNDIATKSSNISIANDYGDLDGVFKDIAKQVSAVYQVTYNRSDQILDEPMLIEFQFTVDKI